MMIKVTIFKSKALNVIASTKIKLDDLKVLSKMHLTAQDC